MKFFIRVRNITYFVDAGNKQDLQVMILNFVEVQQKIFSDLTTRYLTSFIFNYEDTKIDIKPICGISSAGVLKLMKLPDIFTIDEYVTYVTSIYKD